MVYALWAQMQIINSVKTSFTGQADIIVWQPPVSTKQQLLSCAR
jgi:hypothetical protein